jgi:hypothetical protein
MSACRSTSGTASQATTFTPLSGQASKVRKTASCCWLQGAGYNVLLTVDQGTSQQQRSASRKLSIVVVRSRTNQIEDLLPFVDAILKALTTIKPGQIVLIP